MFKAKKKVDCQPEVKAQERVTIMMDRVVGFYGDRLANSVTRAFDAAGLIYADDLIAMLNESPLYKAACIAKIKADLKKAEDQAAAEREKLAKLEQKP